MLSDPVQRAAYDEIHGYMATATNPFFDSNASKDHVFVDEFTCIGIDNFLGTELSVCFYIMQLANFMFFMSIQVAGIVPTYALVSLK